MQAPIRQASEQIGQDAGLDGCGGHLHAANDVILTADVYHYHAEVNGENVGNPETTNSLDGVSGSGPFSYEAMRIAPTTCWHGNVDQIENFWAGSQPSYDRSKSGLSSSASDYVQLQPCCGTDASTMYSASGISVNTVEGEGGSGGSDSGSDGSDSDSSSSGYCEGEQDDKGEDCTKKQFGGEFPPTCPPGCTTPTTSTPAAGGDDDDDGGAPTAAISALAALCAATGCFWANW